MVTRAICQPPLVVEVLVVLAVALLEVVTYGRAKLRPSAHITNKTSSSNSGNARRGVRTLYNVECITDLTALRAATATEEH